MNSVVFNLYYQLPHHNGGTGCNVNKEAARAGKKIMMYNFSYSVWFRKVSKI